jgi:hypothetical protein
MKTEHLNELLHPALETESPLASIGAVCVVAHIGKALVQAREMA